RIAIIIHCAIRARGIRSYDQSASLINQVSFAQRGKVDVLIHTRLQPGDWECQEKRKPFKTVSSLCLAQFTWLKESVRKSFCVFSVPRWCILFLSKSQHRDTEIT